MAEYLISTLGKKFLEYGNVDLSYDEAFDMMIEFVQLVKDGMIFPTDVLIEDFFFSRKRPLLLTKTKERINALKQK
jgi:hypothetical protein